MAKLKVSYGFLKSAKTVKLTSGKFKEYSKAFQNESVPKIKETQARKADAQESAYKILIN